MAKKRPMTTEELFNSYMDEVMPKKPTQGIVLEANGVELLDTLIDMEGFLPEKKVMKSDV